MRARVGTSALWHRVVYTLHPCLHCRTREAQRNITSKRKGPGRLCAASVFAWERALNFLGISPVGFSSPAPSSPTLPQDEATEVAGLQEGRLGDVDEAAHTADVPVAKRSQDRNLQRGMQSPREGAVLFLVRGGSGDGVIVASLAALSPSHLLSDKTFLFGHSMGRGRRGRGRTQSRRPFESGLPRGDLRGCRRTTRHMSAAEQEADGGVMSSVVRSAPCCRGTDGLCPPLAILRETEGQRAVTLR